MNAGLADQVVQARHAGRDSGHAVAGRVRVRREELHHATLEQDLRCALGAFAKGAAEAADGHLQRDAARDKVVGAGRVVLDRRIALRVREEDAIASGLRREKGAVGVERPFAEGKIGEDDIGSLERDRIALPQPLGDTRCKPNLETAHKRDAALAGMRLDAREGVVTAAA